MRNIRILSSGSLFGDDFRDLTDTKKVHVKDSIEALYESVPWLYTAINIRAQKVQSMPRAWVDQNGNEVDTPDMIRSSDFDRMLNMVEAWLCIFGQAFVIKDQNRLNKVIRLLPAHPKTMKVKYDKNTGEIIKIIRSIGGKEQSYDPSEIIVIDLPTRKYEIGKGEPPAVAALNAAGVLNRIDLFEYVFFKNSTIRPTILSAEGINEKSPDLDRITNTFKRLVSGVKNAFGVTTISRKIEVNQLGTDFRGLAMEELAEQKRQDVSTALGIPHSMLMSNAANYATSHQDAINLYEQTIIPECDLIFSAINNQTPELGYRIITKKDRLETFQKQEAEKANSLIQLVSAQIMTIEEARMQLGLDNPLRIMQLPPLTHIKTVEINEGDNEPEAIKKYRYTLSELSKWERFEITRLTSREKRQFVCHFVDQDLQAAIRLKLFNNQDGKKGVKSIFRQAVEASKPFAPVINYDDVRDVPSNYNDADKEKAIKYWEDNREEFSDLINADIEIEDEL